MKLEKGHCVVFYTTQAGALRALVMNETREYIIPGAEKVLGEIPQSLKVEDDSLELWLMAKIKELGLTPCNGRFAGYAFDISG